VPLSNITPLDRAEVEARLASAGITISRARLRDIPAMARIQRQSFPPRLAYGYLTLLLLLLMPSTRCLNAYRDGEPVGTIIGDRYDGDARVVNLAVRPDARRHGVGAALLLRLEDELPDGDMVLMVQQENEGAHTLYRRAGYVDVGTAPNYYGRHRNGIWMRKHRSKRGSPTAEPLITRP
jgi:ribosomal-protein-alanine N-acetyltransferase